jgi:(p)ppGpp synthase/HD superfamily hydrolase
MKDSLRRILREPPEIGMVKMADRISNLSEPPRHWTAERSAGYRDEAQLIHDSLKHSHEGMATRLLQKIEEYRKHL